MFLVSFKEFGLWPNFHGCLQKHKCFWKVKYLQISTVALCICGFCMKVCGADCLVPFDFRDLGICRFGHLREEKGSCSQSPIRGGYGGWLWWVLWVLPPLFPLTHLSQSSFLLSPPLRLSRPTHQGSDAVKEQSRWWRTVDIIMLLVTVILKHLVLNVC